MGRVVSGGDEVHLACVTSLDLDAEDARDV